MIPVTTFRDLSVLVFGLGGSGLATARALMAGGAKVVAFDDSEQCCENARQQGIEVRDLRPLDFTDYAALVLAPGVPLTHPEPHWSVKQALAAPIDVIGDIELFNRERLRHAPSCAFIAITGTNGKSTTAALIAHVLKEAGKDVQLGGNIGRATLSLDAPTSDRCYVIECSSYQIDLAPGLRPSIGVHLNLSADHLDRHGTIDHYAEVKARLVLQSDHAVIGVDDHHSQMISDHVESEGIPLDRVSLRGAGNITGSACEVFEDGEGKVTIGDIASLRGEHNLQNASAAYAVCRRMGLSGEQIQNGFYSFPGLAHRMEQVAEKDGILFINDSKATNAEATARALSSFEQIYWILGGQAKDGGIENLNAFFPKIVHAFLIGDASSQFAETLKDDVAFTRCETLDNACEKAVSMAFSANSEVKQGSVVLLSPACASWDQFANFESRGNRFKKMIRKILQERWVLY